MALTSAVKWDCPTCTYLNWSSSPKCTLCGSPRPADIIPKSTIAKLKLQTQATLSSNKGGGNHSASALPSEWKPGVGPVPRSPNMSSNAIKWRCSVCTYHNWPNTTTCTMCRTARNNGRSSARPPTKDSPRAGSRFESILDYASGGSGLLEVPPLGSSKRKTPRHGQRSSPHHHDNRNSRKWRCSRCTYENWPRSGKCVMCHMVRNRTPSPPLSDQSHQSPGAIENPLRGDREEEFQPQPVSSSSPSSPTSPYSSLKQSSAPNVHSATCSLQPPSLPAVEVSTVHVPPLPKSTNDRVRQIRNRLSASDWLFLSACQGVVSGDLPPVRAYLKHGGDRGRSLTNDEVIVLNDSAKFTVGSTLVHLAIRYMYQYYTVDPCMLCKH